MTPRSKRRNHETNNRISENFNCVWDRLAIRLVIYFAEGGFFTLTLVDMLEDSKIDLTEVETEGDIKAKLLAALK